MTTLTSVIVVRYHYVYIRSSMAKKIRSGDNSKGGLIMAKNKLF